MSATAGPQLTYWVDHRKITDYLLHLNHPDPQARAKALFFYHWGFSRNRPSEFADALIDHPSSALLASTTQNNWGDKFIYEGALQTPKGLCQKIRSVWIVRSGSTNAAELCTTYRF